VAIVYQISLHGSAYDARGKDWNTVEKETGCARNAQWRDPILDRPLLVTEFGCAVSHLRVWEKVAASNRNGIILEEDAVYESIDPSAVDTLLKEHDSVWLGYRLNTLGYWYNCHAYAIRPETAKRLIEGYKDAIIPVDEWVPAKLKVQSNFFFTPEVVKQIPREVRPSTIEGESMQVYVLTVGTDKSKMWALEQSAKAHGITYLNLGRQVTWMGGTMEAQGGGQKINLVRNHLDLLHDGDVVLFVDGYDVIINDTLPTILERYEDMGADIIFAAEKNCWPDATMASEFPLSTLYRYLNSGAYIGKVGALKEFLNEAVPNDSDDQLWMQKRFLSSDWQSTASANLDYEGYIFQCDDDIEIINGQLSNGMCCPCIYHGNGGDDAKVRFKNLADKFGYVEEAEVLSPAYHKGLEYERVAPEILVAEFMSEAQCQRYIEASESLGRWGELDGDKFPAQEIRLKELGLWDEISEQWADKLSKICERHWHPEAYLGLRDAFTMRYSMETQTELGLHTDASLFTGSVKLNDNYAGAELVFPRQEFTNKSVKVGQCILFPSMVTHGHKVLPLRGGKKYSLTMWTCRYEGDSN
jgi:GR25 family glycosyltransferase involved in LPS biosynthesis